MKKILFFGSMLLVLMFITACASTSGFVTGFAQGYTQGSQGRRLIGSASSASNCHDMAVRAGCSNSYRFYSDTGNCFCE